jgi:hypothetical protein
LSHSISQRIAHLIFSTILQGGWRSSSFSEKWISTFPTTLPKFCPLMSTCLYNFIPWVWVEAVICFKSVEHVKGEGILQR